MVKWLAIFIALAVPRLVLADSSPMPQDAAPDDAGGRVVSFDDLEDVEDYLPAPLPKEEPPPPPEPIARNDGGTGFGDLKNAEEYQPAPVAMEEYRPAPAAENGGSINFDDLEDVEDYLPASVARGEFRPASVARKAGQNGYLVAKRPAVKSTVVPLKLAVQSSDDIPVVSPVDIAEAKAVARELALGNEEEDASVKRMVYKRTIIKPVAERGVYTIW